MCVTRNNSNNSLSLLLHGFVLSVLILKIIADPIPTTDQVYPECNNNQGTCKVVSDFNVSILNTQRYFERDCEAFNLVRGQYPMKPYILNGEKAEPKEFPFMALIGLRNINTNKVQWTCGGTLISRNYVLTAAHCLITMYPNPEFHIRLGELDYDNPTDDAQPQDFVAINYTIHPDYKNTINQHNDIALLQLNKNADLNEYVMPACLLLKNNNEFVNVTAAGWGETKETRQPSSHLMKVTLQIFDMDVCINRMPDNIVNVSTQICAGSFNSTSDTCLGDSGGPIFVTHPGFRGMWQVTGVTSYGVGSCGNQTTPSIYTRVQAFLDWIEKIVWGL